MASSSRKKVVLDTVVNDKATASLTLLSKKIERLTDPLRKVRQEFARVEHAMRPLLSDLERFSRRMEKVGKMGMLAISTPLALGAGLSVKMAGTFEAELNKVNSLVKGSSLKTRKILEETALDINRATQFTGQDALLGMKYIVTSGMDSMEEITKVIRPVVYLTGAGQINSDISLGETSNIMTNLMKQFDFKPDKAIEVADKLTHAFTKSNQNLSELWEALKVAGPLMKEASPLADKTKVFDQTLAYLMNMANVGIKESIAGTALAGFNTRLMNLTPEGMKTLADRYGFKRNDVNQFLDPSGKIKDSTKFLKLIDEKKVRPGDFMKIIGAEAGKYLISQSKQHGTLQALTAEIAKLTRTKANMQMDSLAERVNRINLEGLNGSLTLLWSTVENLALRVANTGLLQWATSLSNTFRELLDSLLSLKEGTFKFLTFTGLALSVLFPLRLGLGLFAKALAWLLPRLGFAALNMGRIAGFLGRLWGKLPATFKLLTGEIIKTLFQLLKKVLNPLIGAPLIGALMSIFSPNSEEKADEEKSVEEKRPSDGQKRFDFDKFSRSVRETKKERADVKVSVIFPNLPRDARVETVNPSRIPLSVELVPVMEGIG